jgi:hypothetical protein
VITVSCRAKECGVKVVFADKGLPTTLTLHNFCETGHRLHFCYTRFGYQNDQDNSFGKTRDKKQTKDNSNSAIASDQCFCRYIGAI